MARLELFTVSVLRIERILFTSRVQMSSLTWNIWHLNTRWRSMHRLSIFCGTSTVAKWPWLLSIASFTIFTEYWELNEEIQELLDHYKVADSVDDALCERYVKKTDKRGNGSTPGLVELRGPTIAKLPATLSRHSWKLKITLSSKATGRICCVVTTFTDFWTYL